MESLKRGASDYLTKPVDADQVASALEPQASPVDHVREFTVPSLARVEWEHIQRVMTECQGNISQAARLARKDRKDFYDVMKKYGIQPEVFRKQQAG